MSRNRAGGVPATGLRAETGGVGGCGFGVEVRGWGGFRGEAEGVGELHDFQVALGGRAGGGLVEGRETNGELGEEGEQFRLGFEGDDAGGGREGGEEAGELNGVAEAVIAADQDVAICVRPAVPDPAQVVGERGVVAACRVAGLLDVVCDVPGRFVVTRARCRHPAIL